ncbi:MAG: DUF2147 domain-containing protein [Weeksellaceae bacterium]|nr:DUF2147 domain-containing protein [Weeksellaceae bacterium]
MKNVIFSLLLMLVGSFAFAQSPIGIWKTMDDETGKAKSHVQIFEQNGLLYGKVVKILDPAKQNAVCKDCSGERKNQRILGMQILSGLKKNGSKWDGGKIIDPNKGKEYSSSLELDGNDTLKVRGYMGISLLGRTQTWHRVK